MDNMAVAIIIRSIEKKSKLEERASERASETSRTSKEAKNNNTIRPFLSRAKPGTYQPTFISAR